ncbi:unnamed protein product [Cylicostephanus goldi]|uniref:Uncharacterized protein n=1 Tax=Cylicostephanus goldi TaxID=71465 RepID=A0A3P7ND20_CYLGO|nr:unnamed protein product [Cylicostephanus goldi]
MGEDGEVTSRTVKGNGTSLSSLLSPQREKKRGCRARRELAAKLALEEEERNGCPAEEEPEKAKIRYTLLQDAPVYYGAYMRRGSVILIHLCR